jgi:hypothetical protein
MFELFYANGGHGGPYPGLDEAKRWASNLLKGNPTETAIYIKPYTKNNWLTTKPVATVTKAPNGAICVTDHN